MKIKYKQISQDKIFDKPTTIINYHPSYFGFVPISGDGKNVRLCIIDTGVPQIENHAIDLYKCKNFTHHDIYDVHGHATAITGLLTVKNKHIVGMTPNADIYYAKAISDVPQNTKIDSVIESLLWSITREVDIVLMSFGIENDHQGFHDAIKKVRNSGIGIIAAGGDFTKKTNDAYFPARYDEVFAVGYSQGNQSAVKLLQDTDCSGIVLTYQEYETIFVNNKYIKFGGSSASAAAVSGLAILCIQTMRSRGINPQNIQLLYNQIGKFAIKN